MAGVYRLADPGGNTIRRYNSKSLLPCSALALYLEVALPAQVDTGAVSGTITDASGAAAPGVSVKILHEETGRLSEGKTNESGFYAAPGIRPGRYIVTAQKSGFRTVSSQPIELRVQDRVDVSLQLEVGPISSQMTVSTGPRMIESGTASLGQVIEDKVITGLPLNGRSLMQLATLEAGTLPSTRSIDRDSFISSGGRSVQNTYLLDGIDNKNRVMGSDRNIAQVIQPVVDAVQEFKIQASTFSAEFGEAAGGVINVSLKSGTNQLHGDLFEFFRNSRLDAAPYFQPTGSKPQFIQNQFGAAVGGPLIRNRTFFFGSWQSLREISAAPQIGTVPTEPMRRGIQHIWLCLQRWKDISRRRRMRFPPIRPEWRNSRRGTTRSTPMVPFRRFRERVVRPCGGSGLQLTPECRTILWPLEIPISIAFAVVWNSRASLQGSKNDGRPWSASSVSLPGQY